MHDCASFLPTYASDTSGVCSALYELGGLTVVHDASGCNSTYSTFDEPRWYDQESLIYISGLTEFEAILGDEERFIKNIVETALELKPNFIALCGSPMPLVLGTDFVALAKEIEGQTKIPTLGLKTNGMDSYLLGEAKAWQSLVEILQLPKKTKKNGQILVNLLGLSPLDFGLFELSALKTWLNSEDLSFNASLALGTNWEELQNLTSAKVNLVLSAAALSSAKYLEETFGIPYVLGRPYGAFGKILASNIHEAAKDGKSYTLTRENLKANEASPILIIGEVISASSLASALAHEHLLNLAETQIFSPLELTQNLLGPKDLGGLEDENLCQAQINKAKLIIADPLYQVLVPKEIPFVPYPHPAFSGRIYLDKLPNLYQDSLKTWFRQEEIC
ncbi:MAG: hypothetical protein IJS50_04180 [Desulfovibrio sp.]|nr:hypothetical protein [Desulfovibrio sp.]